MPKLEAQGLPISLNDWIIIQSLFHNGGDCSILARYRSQGYAPIDVFCEFFLLLIMVLDGGDGSKPSVSFLKFEPKVSNFP